MTMDRMVRWFVGIVCALACLFPLPAWAAPDWTALTDPGDLPRLEGPDGRAFPLTDTQVKATLTGFVGQIEVRQTYENPHETPIEATYVFPLPENSAVDDMQIVIGDRIIRADIQPREAARATYESAKRQGYTAALLEQERTNVFTQSVANIAPKEKIDVVIHYVQDLTFDDGTFEFVFPMVVGPRFIHGNPVPGRSGNGMMADTDAVPDASRVSPPIAGTGTRTGHDIGIDVHIDPGVPIHHFAVPTHDVSHRKAPNGTIDVSLANGTSIPNRDFVLRYSVADSVVQSTLFTSGSENAGHFTLIVYPPRTDLERTVGKRELIFVVDVSGSMSGVPLALCKAAMRDALTRVRPVDTFNVITFSGWTGKAFASPHPANDTNIRSALEFIDGLAAGGGTRIEDAIAEALTPPVEQNRHRYVFFLTDGQVDIEKQVYQQTKDLIHQLERRGQRARVFAFGVGSSPNRSLLARLVHAGDGVVLYGSAREDPARAVGQYFRMIDHVIWTDLGIDWMGMKVSQLHPQGVDALFASRPAILHGRYEGTARGAPVLHAKTTEGIAATSPILRSQDPHDATIAAKLWARARIGDLSLAAFFDGEHSVRDEITELGLLYRLVTQYTSFVAVDTSRVVSNGDPESIVQPLDAPEAVDMEMAGPQQMMYESSSVRHASPSRGGAYEGGAPRAPRRDHRPSGGCAHCSLGSSDATALLWAPIVAIGRRRRKRPA